MKKSVRMTKRSTAVSSKSASPPQSEDAGNGRGCGDSSGSENQSTTSLDETSKKKTFRDAIQKEIHNRVEMKRKARMNEWLQKIIGVLPKDNRKPTILLTLERAYDYIVRLKGSNDNLMNGALRDTEALKEFHELQEQVVKLSQLVDKYASLLKLAGISVPSEGSLENLESILTHWKNKQKQTEKGETIGSENEAEKPSKPQKPKSRKDKKIVAKSDSRAVAKISPLIKSPSDLIALAQNAPSSSNPSSSVVTVRPAMEASSSSSGLLSTTNSPVVVGSQIFPATYIISGNQLLPFIPHGTSSSQFVMSSPIVLPIGSATPPTSSVASLHSDVSVGTTTNEPTFHDVAVETHEAMEEPSESAGSRLDMIVESIVDDDHHHEDTRSRHSDRTAQAAPDNASEGEEIEPHTERRKFPKIKISRKFKKKSRSDLAFKAFKRSFTRLMMSSLQMSASTILKEKVLTNETRAETKSQQSGASTIAGTSAEGPITASAVTNTTVSDSDKPSNEVSERILNPSTPSAHDILMLESLSSPPGSVQSVSNSSLPNFLCLSPADHLTEYLQKDSHEHHHQSQPNSDHQQESVAESQSNRDDTNRAIEEVTRHQITEEKNSTPNRAPNTSHQEQSSTQQNASQPRIQPQTPTRRTSYSAESLIRQHPSTVVTAAPSATLSNSLSSNFASSFSSVDFSTDQNRNEQVASASRNISWSAERLLHPIPSTSSTSRVVPTTVVDTTPILPSLTPVGHTFDPLLSSACSTSSFMDSTSFNRGFMSPIPGSSTPSSSPFFPLSHTSPSKSRGSSINPSHSSFTPINPFTCPDNLNQSQSSSQTTSFLSEPPSYNHYRPSRETSDSQGTSSSPAPYLLPNQLSSAFPSTSFTPSSSYDPRLPTPVFGGHLLPSATSVSEATFPFNPLSSPQITSSTRRPTSSSDRSTSARNNSTSNNSSYNKSSTKSVSQSKNLSQTSKSRGNSGSNKQSSSTSGSRSQRSSPSTSVSIPSPSCHQVQVQRQLSQSASASTRNNNAQMLPNPNYNTNEAHVNHRDQQHSQHHTAHHQHQQQQPTQIQSLNTSNNQQQHQSTNNSFHYGTHLRSNSINSIGGSSSSSGPSSSFSSSQDVSLFHPSSLHLTSHQQINSNHQLQLQPTGTTSTSNSFHLSNILTDFASSTTSNTSSSATSSSTRISASDSSMTTPSFPLFDHHSSPSITTSSRSSSSSSASVINSNQGRHVVHQQQHHQQGSDHHQNSHPQSLSQSQGQIHPHILEDSSIATSQNYYSTGHQAPYNHQQRTSMVEQNSTGGNRNTSASSQIGVSISSPSTSHSHSSSIFPPPPPPPPTFGNTFVTGITPISSSTLPPVAPHVIPAPISSRSLSASSASSSSSSASSSTGEQQQHARGIIPSHRQMNGNDGSNTSGGNNVNNTNHHHQQSDGRRRSNSSVTGGESGNNNNSSGGNSGGKSSSGVNSKTNTAPSNSNSQVSSISSSSPLTSVVASSSLFSLVATSSPTTSSSHHQPYSHFSHHPSPQPPQLSSHAFLPHSFASTASSSASSPVSSSSLTSRVPPLSSSSASSSASSHFGMSSVLSHHFNFMPDHH